MSDGAAWYCEYVKESYDRWLAAVGRVGVRQRHDQRDLVQRVFEELWKNFLAGRIATDRGALDAFMWRRLRDRVIDRWRAMERRPEALTGEFMQELQAEAGPVAARNCSDHWDSVIDGQKWLLDLVNTLPDCDRGHVVLVALGADSKTRAELLNLTAGNERVRWCRLKKRLAAQLGPAMKEQGVSE